MLDPAGDLSVTAPVLADPLANKRLNMSLHVLKVFGSALLRKATELS